MKFDLIFQIFTQFVDFHLQHFIDFFILFVEFRYFLFIKKDEGEKFMKCKDITQGK